VARTGAGYGTCSCVKAVKPLDNAGPSVAPGTAQPMPPLARRTVLAVLAFEAAGAFVGGPMLFLAPDGSMMKIPVAELRGFFPDFFVPGLILTALGVLNAVGFIALLRRSRFAWLWVGLALGGFFVWFAVELAVVGAKSWAQAAWGIPVLIGLGASWPLVRGLRLARLRRQSQG